MFIVLSVLPSFTIMHSMVLSGKLLGAIFLTASSSFWSRIGIFSASL